MLDVSAERCTLNCGKPYAKQSGMVVVSEKSIGSDGMFSLIKTPNIEFMALESLDRQSKEGSFSLKDSRSCEGCQE